MLRICDGQGVAMITGLSQVRVWVRVTTRTSPGHDLAHARTTKTSTTNLAG